MPRGCSSDGVLGVTSQTSPTRILRVIARLNTGGPALHTILLTHGLNGNGFASRLVTGVVDSSEGDMGYYARRLQVIPLVIPELGRRVALGNDLRAFVRLFRLIRRERPDILHTHTAKAGGLGRLAALLHNGLNRLGGGGSIRLVHTFHGHLFHGYFPPFWSWLLILGERLLSRFTDRIITVSESVKRDLVERYRICGAEKITVVPLGLDFDWVSDLEGQAGRLRLALNLPSETVTVGIVGRLTSIKNHALLLAALRRVAGRNIRAILVGDGELREALEGAVRDHGLEEIVIFTGWQQDRARIYADLDIVCLTSRNEGTPVALIEAMAAGTPIVATRVGGVPDLMVGKGEEQSEGFELFSNGVLVPPDEPDLLAAALDFLAARPALRHRMGAVGRAAVLQRFSRERLIQEMQAMYTALLAPVASEGSCGR